VSKNPASCKNSTSSFTHNPRCLIKCINPSPIYSFWTYLVDDKELYGLPEIVLIFFSGYIIWRVFFS